MTGMKLLVLTIPLYLPVPATTRHVPLSWFLRVNKPKNFSPDGSVYSHDPISLYSPLTSVQEPLQTEVVL